MQIRSTHRCAVLARLFAIFTVVPMLACGDDDPAGPGADAILGGWEVTSLVYAGVDLVTTGMDLEVTLNSDGTYRFEVTNDQVGACDGAVGSDCQTTGSYAHTATTVTTVTIDDDEPVDAVTFHDSITGNGDSMTWTGTIEGLSAEITLQRLWSRGDSRP